MALLAIYDLYSNIVTEALSVFKIMLNKCRCNFIIDIFMFYLSTHSRINLLQLGLCSLFGAQRIRRQDETRFDFLTFIKALSAYWISLCNAVTFNPSFTYKPSKQKPGIGYYWSGCAGKAVREIEIMGLFVIDDDTRLSFHLDAIQTPPTSCLRDDDLALVHWYAGTIRNPIKQILSITRYAVADAYFSKKNFSRTNSGNQPSSGKQNSG